MPKEIGYDKKRRKAVTDLEGVGTGGGNGTPTNGQGLPVATRKVARPIRREVKAKHSTRAAKRTRASGVRPPDRLYPSEGRRSPGLN
jgi:hypothetical protein